MLAQVLNFFSSGIGKSRPLLSAIAMASLAPEVEFEVVLKNTFMEVRVREAGILLHGVKCQGVWRRK